MTNELVGRDVQQSNCFARPELKKLNILQLATGVFQRICKSVDSRWREVAALADNTKYKLGAYEVEECARVLLSRIDASPTQQLLIKFANRNMTVGELVLFLDRLRIEEALTELCDPVSLRITEHPEAKLIVTEGDKLELTCSATGFPYPQYCWFKEQQQLTFSDRSTLVLNDVRQSANGRYLCRVHHMNHVTRQVVAVFTTYCEVIVEPRPFALRTTRMVSATQLGVYTDAGGCAPTFTEHPTPQRLRTGDALLLTCQAYGQPMPRYHWVKDGMSVGTGQHYRVLNASTDNSGEYYCIACNSVGETQSEAVIVSVLPEMYSQLPAKPKILKQPVDQSHGIGGEAVFTVEVEYCGGKLSYQWFCDSEPIPGETSAQLRVNVNGFYNKGLYQCRIHTSDNQEVLSRQAQLTVTQGPLVYTAADKLALFIGVSTYKMHGVPLPAVEHDLQESVKAFERLQFKVISLLDLTLNEMKGAIQLFCQSLSPDVYVVFYCAGHGFVGADGRHYLVPWDAHHDTNPKESLCIETVEDNIQQKKPKLLMFFLDICRKRHQNIEAPPTAFTRIEAVPNKIVLYAASEGQQAYEESKKCSSVPRGLFNQYLLDVIDRPLHAFELYYCIMDKFKACPYDREKFPQFPAMLTNNEDYRRTLHDPIDTKAYHLHITERMKFMESIHRMPPAMVVTITEQCSVAIKFARVTSNVLEMSAVPSVSGRCWQVSVRLLEESVPTAVKPVKGYIQDNGITFKFSNLQRLEGMLKVHVVFVLTAGTQQLQSAPYVIDLGRPLISVCGLDAWTTADSAVEPMERKQPMEHTEDHSMQSDSGQ